MIPFRLLLTTYIQTYSIIVHIFTIINKYVIKIPILTGSSNYAEWEQQVRRKAFFISIHSFGDLNITLALSQY